MAAASLVEPRLGWQPAQAGHAGCRQAKAAASLKMMAGGSVALRAEPRQGRQGKQDR